jgi:hypothetical protein
MWVSSEALKGVSLHQLFKLESLISGVVCGKESRVFRKGCGFNFSPTEDKSGAWKGK